MLSGTVTSPSIPELLEYANPTSETLGLEALGSEEPLEAFLARVHPEDRLAVTEGLARCTASTGEVSLTYMEFTRVTTLTPCPLPKGEGACATRP